MGFFSSENVRRLLHNKFVAVLGDSIQRSVYKDLVKLLQGDKYLSDNELRKKGEMSFANDVLVEGGSLGEMHNGVNYREVRQYRSGHHLVRFYFLTRAYSEYVESVLADFKAGPPPDVVIMNSCIWDLIRYGSQPMNAYKTNLDHLFSRLTEVLSPECLVIWNMTMPVGFKPGEIPEYTKHNLRWDVIEGNFYSSTLANLHKMDVVDMHYHFRFDLRSRCKDFIHWNQLAHRKYSQILLAHIAQAWGVQLPDALKVKSQPVPCDPPPVVPMRNLPLPLPKYILEVSPHGLGHPIPRAPSPVFPLRDFPHPFPQFNNQEFDQRFFGPTYVEGYTAFDTDDRETIESFMRGPMGVPAKQMGSNALSPFVSDNPFLFGNIPPRNGGFGGYGKVPVPTINNHPFGGMAIPPYHLTMPEMAFGTFHYSATWSEHHRLKRRDIRPPHGWMHPYQRHPYSTRN